MMSQRTYQGQCHCGAVRFAVEADLARAEVIECNCSICRRKGFMHLIVEPEAFALERGADELVIYQFGTRQAVHKFCGRCGIHPFYTPRSHPDKVDVNVRCLEGVELDELRVRPFDGRNWEERIGELRESE